MAWPQPQTSISCTQASGASWQAALLSALSYASSLSTSCCRWPADHQYQSPHAMSGSQIDQELQLLAAFAGPAQQGLVQHHLQKQLSLDHRDKQLALAVVRTAFDDLAGHGPPRDTGIIGAAELQIAQTAATDHALPAEALIAQPLVELDGKQYLPSTATGAQVLQLLVASRPDKKRRRKESTKMAGIDVTFHWLYNVVQAHGGYAQVLLAQPLVAFWSNSPAAIVQVYADSELRDSVLDDLCGQPRAHSAQERTALKRTYEQWLGPLTQQMPAASTAEVAGESFSARPPCPWHEQPCMPRCSNIRADAGNQDQTPGSRPS